MARRFLADMATRRWFTGGEVIGQSTQPLHAAARWLLDNGIADARDEIATYRGETLSMHGIVGDMAKFTVEESDGKPLRSRPWKPFSRGDVAARTAETVECVRGLYPWSKLSI
jgi:hypothetical protein